MVVTMWFNFSVTRSMVEFGGKKFEKFLELRDYGEEGGEKGPHPLAQAGTGSFPGGFIGKHRLQAAITNLNNQISILQEELEKVETIGESSTVCKE
ncbi:hypothetical protein JHK84_031357 [Glycine max]|nr:hypothetical protein JHK84_031357 [Glycine max]